MAPELATLPREGEETAEAARALALADAFLGWVLGAAWLLEAVAGDAAPLLRVGLGACGVGALAGAWPRPVSAAGLVLGLLAAPGVALAGSAAARLVLRLGGGEELLARVRRLRLLLFRALLEVERQRARGDLHAAGDAMERAGRARTDLRVLGVEPSWSFRLGTLLGRARARLGRKEADRRSADAYPIRGTGSEAEGERRPER